MKEEGVKHGHGAGEWLDTRGSQLLLSLLHGSALTSSIPLPRVSLTRRFDTMRPGPS